ncbi:glycoside hydrolase family 3 N-terminal domain-containing protein [Acidaminococcus fermentans]|uniref:glycoside hydrolase family 3 N-terminal domain-containing protein n=1 Tax=Acidaminococcus fermentans TaxID=905 RepID=UPI0024326384|nr:glycoside hydrolase family 3 N-terminal domain-containing protein [Acidaminococcus fermentans]
MVLRPRFPREHGTGKPTQGDPIREKIAAMAPEEKAGQLMLVGMEGTEPSAAFQKELQENHYGGVILFDRNMKDPNQVKALNSRLQDLARPEPLLIGVDEEGGQVARMKDQLPAPPSQEAIGRTGDPAQAEAWAAKTGTRLKALGFNLNLAPVADVGSGMERSYSSHPATAAKFVEGALAWVSEGPSPGLPEAFSRAGEGKRGYPQGPGDRLRGPGDPAPGRRAALPAGPGKIP